AASLTISTPGGINASASFGFVGVKLTGNADLTGSFETGLQDPSTSGDAHDGKISLTEFINGLKNIGSLLEPPSIVGGGTVHLEVGLDTGGVSLPFITLNNAAIDINVLNLGDIFNHYADSLNFTSGVTRVDANTFTLTGDHSTEFIKGSRVTA